MENPFINPFREDPFEEEVEDVEDARDQNPYTSMEGYKLEDTSGIGIGRIEGTVYDAVSDVLKYVTANGRAIPADRLEVDAENGRVRVPYDRETIESAPALQDPASGEFDRALRAHYGELA